MREIVERAYFAICLILSCLLRPVRYSSARPVNENFDGHVRKRRPRYAALVVWMGAPAMKLLRTGVRILPEREWAERERRVNQSVYHISIGVDVDGTVVLPCFGGHTLAALLADEHVDDRARKWVIERAVVALADFHSRGFTHGQAIADNVMLNAGVARWFDFETVHEMDRPTAWQRADDLRALLVTCLVRTAPGKRADILQFMLDVYADREVTGLLDTSFTSTLHRPLTFHLSQAPMSFGCYREIGRLLHLRRQVR